MTEYCEDSTEFGVGRRGCLAAAEERFEGRHFFACLPARRSIETVRDPEATVHRPVVAEAGTYTLTDLPSGLVQLSIEAPNFPATTRTAAVAADADAVTPPQLSDWVVERGSTKGAESVLHGIQIVASGRILTEPGFVRGTFAVEFNVHHDDITGIVPVVYALDGTGTWRIVSGADPKSRLPDSRKIVTLTGNSADNQDTLSFLVDASLPKELPGDPTTEIQTTAWVFVRVSEKDQKVPPDPTHAGFGVPAH